MDGFCLAVGRFVSRHRLRGRGCTRGAGGYAGTALGGATPEPGAPTATPEPRSGSEVDSTPEPRSGSGPTTKPADPRDEEPTPAEACAGLCWDEVFPARASAWHGRRRGVLPEMAGVNERIGRAGYDELGTFTTYFTMSVPLSIDHFMLLAQVGSPRFRATTRPTGRVLAWHAFGRLVDHASRGARHLPVRGHRHRFGDAHARPNHPTRRELRQRALRLPRACELDALAFVGTTGMAAELLVGSHRRPSHPWECLHRRPPGRGGLLTASDWSLGPGLGSVPDGPRPPLGGYFGSSTPGFDSERADARRGTRAPWRRGAAGRFLDFVF